MSAQPHLKFSGFYLELLLKFHAKLSWAWKKFYNLGAFSQFQSAKEKIKK